MRTRLVDANILDPILRILIEQNDENDKNAACATLCNLVLDFSPMKTSAISKGALDAVLLLLGNMNSSLRLNAVWALKNLLYMAEPTVKRAVMDKLTYERLYQMTLDPDVEVQVQALNMLRNLACGDDAV